LTNDSIVASRNCHVRKGRNTGISCDMVVKLSSRGQIGGGRSEGGGERGNIGRAFERGGVAGSGRIIKKEGNVKEKGGTTKKKEPVKSSDWGHHGEGEGRKKAAPEQRVSFSTKYVIM